MIAIVRATMVRDMPTIRHVADRITKQLSHAGNSHAAMQAGHPVAQVREMPGTMLRARPAAGMHNSHVGQTTAHAAATDRSNQAQQRETAASRPQ